MLALLITTLYEPHITLDSEETGAEIIIKYIYRKQEWWQRRPGRRNIPPVCQRDGEGENLQADFQSPQHKLKAYRHILGQKDCGCELDAYIIFNKC